MQIYSENKQSESISATPLVSEPILEAEPKSALGAKIKSTSNGKSKYISKAEAKGKSKPELKSIKLMNLKKWRRQKADHYQNRHEINVMTG